MYGYGTRHPLSELTKRCRSHYADGVPFTIPDTDELLSDMFAKSVRCYPDRVAVDFMGATLTFRELGDEVRKVAAVLEANGIGIGDRVALILPNCPQAISVFFGALFLGAVVAEHNPLAPAKELNEQIERHQAKVVLVWENSAEKIVEQIPKRKVFTVNLAAGMPAAKQFALKLPIKKARDLRNKLRATCPPGTTSWDKTMEATLPISRGRTRVPVDSAAVLLHTGGTTGVPKAVILTHRNVVTNIESGAKWIVGIREGAETFYNALPFFHAFGMTMTMVGAVRFGATAVVFPNFDVDMMLDTVSRRPPTFMLGVPPMFDRLARRAKERGVDLTTLHYAICGAMPLPAKTARLWEEVTRGYIIEGYGLSETSPILTGSPMNPSRRPGTLGLAFPSVNMRLVDPENPTVDVPIGQPGEIIVSGPCVCKGYWNNPEETEKLFTDEGWMRTGDIAREDDGFLIMADRAKELILSGGFNVYPSQVEEAVRSMPGVKDVAVVGLPNEDGEEVVAAIIPEEGATITLEAVRKWAEKSISHYALPRQIAVLSELPRSQIGKIMRRLVKEQLMAAGDLIQGVASSAAKQVSSATNKLLDSSGEKSDPDKDDKK